jgi:hypothetical protein
MNSSLLLGNAFLSGVLINLYDDVKDNNLITNEEEHKSTWMTILKVVIIVSFFILCLSDTTTLFLSIFLLPLFMYLGQLDNYFWNLMISVPVLSLLINYKNIVDNMPRVMVVAIMVVAYVYYEGVSYPEEQSERKTHFRVLTILAGVTIIHFTRGTSFAFVDKIMLCAIGYSMSSMLFNKFFLDYKSQNNTCL